MNKKILLATVSVFMLSVVNGYAATQKEATADVTVKIVGVSDLVKMQDMSFGTLVSPSAQTVVTLDTAGEVSDNIIKVGENAKAAEFEVSGDVGTPYTLSVADINLTTQTGTGSPMKLNNYKIKVNSNDYLANSNAIGAGGKDTILVGADLTVGANQEPGDYQGTITLVASF